MSHDCPCGASFDSLSRFRLHQRDDCPLRDADLDVEDDPVDDIARAVTDELLVCDVCGADQDGAEAIRTDLTDAGLAVVAEFQCPNCGGVNENTAIVE